MMIRQRLNRIFLVGRGRWFFIGLIFGWLWLVVLVAAQLPLVADGVVERVWQAEVGLMAADVGRIRISDEPALTAEAEARWREYLAGHDAGWVTSHQQKMLGELFYERDGERIEWGGEQFDILQWHMFAYNDEGAGMRVVAGHYPTGELTLLEDAVLLEVAMGVTAAPELGLAIGDRWQLQGYDDIWLELVGLVEADDPMALQWEGVNPSRPFEAWERVSFQPEFVEMNSGLILSKGMMTRYFESERVLMILLEPEGMAAEEIPLLAESWRRWQTEVTSKRLETGEVDGSRWDGPIVDLLQRTAAAQLQAQETLAVLTAQLLLLLVYTLWLWGQMSLNQEREAIGMWRVRGVDWRRGMLIYGRRYGLLVLAAWPLGVVAATMLLKEPVLSGRSWLWGGVMGVISWRVLVVQVGLGWNRFGQGASHVGEVEGGRGRHFERALFLSFIGLGMLGWWQLRTATTVDGWLLLSPTMLLLGLALASQQILPWVFGLLGWVGKYGGSGLWSGMLLWWGRANGPRGDSGLGSGRQLVLMMGLAWGVALWSLVGVATMVESREGMVHYRNGAPIRLGVEARDLEAVLDLLRGWSGLEDWSLVWTEQVLTGPYLVPVTAVVVSSPVMRDRLVYPPTMPPITMADWQDMRLDRGMAATSSGPIVPVLISRQYPVGQTGTGDVVSYQTADKQIIEAEIMGLVDTFPTVSPPFVLMDEVMVERVLAAPRVVAPTYQLWLWPSDRDMDTVAFLEAFDLPSRLAQLAPLGEARQLERQYEANMLSQQILALLRYQVPILLGLSALSVAGWRRLSGATEMGGWRVWQALGVAQADWRRVGRWERWLLIGLGLMLGSLLGWLLVSLTEPLWRLVVEEMLGEAPPLYVYWPYELIGMWLLIYGFVYVVALWFGQRGGGR
ncbi:MAG TPA: hypothetical protein VLL52_06105 [Anaerolineae bacterium]|nr:hypothetical protein [Anaerolineae bacterium]